MRKYLIFLLLLASLLTSCLPAAPTQVASTPSEASAASTSTEAAPAQTSWWNDAVFYEIFVRSFYDNNGDGIGDFNGITQKLDYLSSLGVTAVWLMPIFPSPSYHGYDVTDYYAVNPQYGTMDDFKNLLNEAHKRNIRIIIDLVINHTSDQHPWFKSAKSDVNSPYRNWYIWSDTDPKYLGPWGERVWHPSLTGYYYGIFESFMPDLNYNNPEVTKEMEKVVTFWLKDVGVDGFRLDAAKHLIEDGSTQQNTAATHQWYQNFRPVYKAANPQAMTVGEISGDPASVLAKYTSGNELNLAFDFGLAKAFVSSANGGAASYTASALKTDTKIMSNDAFASFLTNHDQDRLMSQLYGSVDKAKVAASLLLTSPGVPFIYYGEEIGMTGKKPDENIRRPMQWDASANGGFTTGKPWRAPDSSFATVNVAAQMNDPASLWSHYRALISIREAHSALREGSLAILPADNLAIFASVRVQNDDKILVLINLSDKPVSDYKLDFSGTPFSSGDFTLAPLMSATGDVKLSAQPLPELAPFTTYIFQIK